ncbi:hypothetical protein R3P38DRAFT_2816042 [Favolaschia claudopus]|uniref:Uncharacterized protein n=1 Tax=Favolaschia claudopus TaxID=2862362 RepID=A0AAV9YZR1_9AGAR
MSASPLPDPSVPAGNAPRPDKPANATPSRKTTSAGQDIPSERTNTNAEGIGSFTAVHPMAVDAVSEDDGGSDKDTGSTDGKVIIAKPMMRLLLVKRRTPVFGRSGGGEVRLERGRRMTVVDVRMNFTSSKAPALASGVGTRSYICTRAVDAEQAEYDLKKAGMVTSKTKSSSPPRYGHDSDVSADGDAPHRRGWHRGNDGRGREAGGACYVHVLEAKPASSLITKNLDLVPSLRRRRSGRGVRGNWSVFRDGEEDESGCSCWSESHVWGEVYAGEVSSATLPKCARRHSSHYPGTRAGPGAARGGRPAYVEEVRGRSHAELRQTLTSDQLRY